MPYALILSGLVLAIAGVRNTQGDLYSLVKGDFSGQGNFVWWTLCIVAIGSLGNIPALKSFTNWLLALIFIAMILAEEKAHGGQGFFSMFNTALNTGLSKDNAADQGPTGNNTPQSTGSTGPANSQGLPDLGINDLLKQGAQGQQYLQQLERAWQSSSAVISTASLFA